MLQEGVAILDTTQRLGGSPEEGSAQDGEHGSLQWASNLSTDYTAIAWHPCSCGVAHRTSQENPKRVCTLKCCDEQRSLPVSEALRHENRRSSYVRTHASGQTMYRGRGLAAESVDRPSQKCT